MKNDYEVRGDVTVIFLKRKDGTRLEALIDTADFDRVNEFPSAWCADFTYSNKEGNNYYVQGVYRRKSYRLHRWLTNPPVNLVIDHINHWGWDNRRCNLRTGTRGENLQNLFLKQEQNLSSGYRGVTRCKKTGLWRAQLTVKGQHYWFGGYRTKEEAILIAKAARAQLMPFSIEAQNKELFKIDISLLSQGRKPCIRNKTGANGVAFDKRRNKWTAQITRNNKSYWLGSFDSREDAIVARRAAEEKFLKGALSL